MLKQYASYFVSYLLFHLKQPENILSIILFGSVARGDFGKDSDIDIFVEVKNKTKKNEEEIERIVEEFYISREGLLFKTRGIDNKINLIVGKFEDWRDLKESIEGTGIVLYGKYIPFKEINGKKMILFSWDKIQKNRGAFLNKIYGFNSGNHNYKGMIELLGGKKIGKSSTMIPIEHREEIIKLFKHYGVNAKAIEVWVK